MLKAATRTETYLQLDCGLAESDTPAKKHKVVDRTSLSCPLSPPPPAPSPRASPDCCSTAPVAKLFCDADSLGDAPSKFTCEQNITDNSFIKRRSGSRYLSVVVTADGIDLYKVGHWWRGAPRASRVCSWSSRGSASSLCRRRAYWHNFLQLDPG